MKLGGRVESKEGVGSGLYMHWHVRHGHGRGVPCARISLCLWVSLGGSLWVLLKSIGTKIEIGPNRWKSVRTDGNRSEQMEIDPNKWKSIRTNGNRSEQMEIDPNKWKSIRTTGNRSELLEIDPNKWKSIQTNGNRSKQMEIDPN
jgi:plasmid maintenance system killer protein